MEKSKIKLTEQQKFCAESIDRSIAIIAGAGSGKTKVLIERIKNIILGRNADLTEVAAITFTEKAAGELIYRLIKELPAEFKPKADTANITTIDGFCANILREDGAVAGLNPDFQILEEHASRILNHRTISTNLKDMLKNGDENAGRLIEELDFKRAVNCMEDMVEARWHSFQNQKSKTKNQKLDGTEQREEELTASIFNCFKKMVDILGEEKRKLGVLDFVDLEIKTLELLKDNEEIRNKYQNRIKHLLIDEYQDTSDLQTEIVKQIYNPKKNILCIVGDPAQSIYRFRGANPKGIHDMKRSIEENGGVSVELNENFRSAEAVISFINSVFTSSLPFACPEQGRRVRGGSGRGRSLPPPTPLLTKEGNSSSNYFMQLVSKVGSTPSAKVAKLVFEVEDLPVEEVRKKEAEAIASYISELKAQKEFNFGDIALLFQSFSDIQIYERALNKHLIPYYKGGGRTLLQQHEIADIILCLKVLSDPTNDTLAYGLARSTIIGLSDEECYKVLFSSQTPSKHCHPRESGDPEQLNSLDSRFRGNDMPMDSCRSLPSAKAGGRNNKKNHLFDLIASDNRFSFLKHLFAVKDHFSISELIREIADVSQLHHVFEALTGSGQPSANIEKLISIVETLSSRYDHTLGEFLEYIDDLKAREIGINEPPVFGQRDDAVKLLTVHAAKGLEFETVILPDLMRRDVYYTLPYIIEKGKGIGFKLTQGTNPLAEREATAAYEDILANENEELALEKERLLYVALTRAKKMLILPLPNNVEENSHWSKKLFPKKNGLVTIGAAADVTASPSEIKDIRTATPLAKTPAAKNTILTVSQLESYHRCPQEYNLKYVLDLPADNIEARGDEMPPNIIGDIVHKLISLASTDKEPDWEALLPVVCREFGYTRPKNADHNKIAKYISNYMESDFYNFKLAGPRHEAPFVLKNDGTIIKGTIDCIFKDDGGYSIVDFKTDRIENDNDLRIKVEGYRLQTLIYAIAAQRALKKNISQMTLLFLYSGLAHDTRLDQKHYEEGALLIEHITGAIRKNEFDIGDKETPCQRCPYHFNRTCWVDSLN